jgi:Cof subfamily protein (haloacid dehalogenase superfamily)
VPDPSSPAPSTGAPTDPAHPTTRGPRAADLDLSGTTAVVLDVDGTIAGADHAVSPRTRAAMAAVDAAGVPVVLATGRSRGSVLDLARAVGLTVPQVSCNGAVVTDPRTGEDLRLRTMPDDETAAFVELAARTGRALTWWTPRDIHVTSEELARWMHAFGHTDVHVVAPPTATPQDVVKAMIYGSRQELDDAGPWVASLAPRATRSMDYFWEISAQDASKWEAVAFVFDRLGVDPAGATGLGDGGNDVVWMERIGNPVSMGDARPEARAAARAAAGRHDEEGAADFLEEVLRQVKRRKA